MMKLCLISMLVFVAAAPATMPSTHPADPDQLRRMVAQLQKQLIEARAQIKSLTAERDTLAANLEAMRLDRAGRDGSKGDEWKSLKIGMARADVSDASKAWRGPDLVEKTAGFSVYRWSWDWAIGTVH